MEARDLFPSFAGEGGRRPDGVWAWRCDASRIASPKNALAPARGPCEKAAHANPADQRRRHPCAGSETARIDRQRAFRRRNSGRARERPVGSRAFALAQRPAEIAGNRPTAFRPEGHADRLRHHGREANPRRSPAGSRALRRQPRPERRRGRDLFGHDRRGDGGGDDRHSLDRALASLWRRGRTAADRMGRDGGACGAGHPHDPRRRHRPGRSYQRQLSPPARRRRSRGSSSPARAGATPN